jgi:hypothetical protein
MGYRFVGLPFIFKGSIVLLSEIILIADCGTVHIVTALPGKPFELIRML